jgi:chromosome partitioning protein
MHRLLTWTSKGGTGKTTTVSNLGPQLAKKGYRVLMVGFDPQADLEASFGIADEGVPEGEGHRQIVRVEQLMGGGIDPHTGVVAIDVPGASGTLSLLPCSPALNEQIGRVAREQFNSLDVLLAKLDDDFDIALIDTQGADSPLSQTAVRAADSLLFSCEPGFFEFRGIERRLDELQALAARASEDAGWEISTLGIVLVKVDERSVDMREWREHFSDYPDVAVFDAFVRARVDVRRHPRHGVPTVLFDAEHDVSKDYAAVAAELTARLAAGAEA